ncbi:LRR receptor-like serine/threonine-protein kinase GSO1 [Linum perenne]
MVDFSGNRLSGSIPREFGRLANLQELHLASNLLTGTIPQELSNCTKLMELGLSGNSISGGIPPRIISLEKLEVVSLQKNKLNGAIPDSFSSSQNLRELQLSSNMLEGHIPCSLSKLKSFSSVLNVSHNKLSGQIPACLGSLDMLEVLDLSSNHFSGVIPARLNNMKTLDFFNISFNELHGKIPVSWERIAAKHPGSYIGNPGLCVTNDARCGSRGRHMSRREVAIVVTIVLLTAALLCAIVVTFTVKVIRYKYERDRDESLLREEGSRSESLPSDLKFEDVIRATESCNEVYMIGRGRHGKVYWTESTHSKKKWAVKKVNLSESDFGHEMRILNMVKHRNAVRMGGYCIANGHCFIVTEYMPGGTLFDALHKEQSYVVLDWEDRFRIALGIAECLSYLHHDCVPQIIHRDVKSDNVLLDSELEPKVADFGMAKLADDHNPDEPSSTVSKIVGTLGYMAPGKC